MAKTFGYRRQEIVHKQPSIEDMLTRWPALFQMEEVCFQMQGTVSLFLRGEGLNIFVNANGVHEHS